MKILILNGPNLNLLGAREEKHYGALTIEELEKQIRNKFPEIEFDFFQSNHEGGLIDQIQNAEEKFDGLIINPGGFAHSSVAIRDALELCKIPKIEVHLSNVSARENFRQKLVTTPVCDGYISGFKLKSYFGAVHILCDMSS
jgi:3-dehydroquinate dehydratase-2